MTSSGWFLTDFTTIALRWDTSLFAKLQFSNTIIITIIHKWKPFQCFKLARFCIINYHPDDVISFVFRLKYLGKYEVKLENMKITSLFPFKTTDIQILCLTIWCTLKRSSDRSWCDNLEKTVYCVVTWKKYRRFIFITSLVIFWR